MCLYTQMKEPGVAGYDITVYKVLEIRRNRLYAPIHAGYKYQLNKLKKARRFDRTEPLGESYLIVKYGFHTYGDRKTAETFARNMKTTHGNEYCAVECVIPKGTRYYKAFGHGGEFMEYCSEQIIANTIKYKTQD